MLNLDVTPAKMSSAEIENWLNECSVEIEKAYNEDNITYAQKLDTIYQVVKQMKIDKIKEESFSGYLKYNNFLNESVTEDGNQETDLIEVDETLNSLKKNLKNSEINLEATATLDEDLKVVDFSPVVIDIQFKLDFLDEPQHIILTYTPSTIPTELNIDSLPKKDYKSTPTETGMEVSFKSISNLADELEGISFAEQIEWPFEMDFKSGMSNSGFHSSLKKIMKRC